MLRCNRGQISVELVSRSAVLPGWLVFYLIYGTLAHGADTQTAALTVCPPSPNCALASTLPGSDLEPFPLVPDAASAWPAVVQAVSELPRSELTVATDNYLRAEVRSAIFGFVDDVEVHLDPDAEVLELRSASRTGYWDLGVNRRRLLELRDTLIRRSVVESPVE